MKALIILFLLNCSYTYSQSEPKLAASSVEPVNHPLETTKAEPQLAAFNIVETSHNKTKNTVLAVPVLAPYSIDPVKKESTSEDKKQ